MIFKLWVTDARYKWQRIRDYVPRDVTVLKIGAGPGSIYLVLRRLGYDVRAVRIEDQTLFWGIELCMANQYAIRKILPDV